MTLRQAWERAHNVFVWTRECIEYEAATNFANCCKASSSKEALNISVTGVVAAYLDEKKASFVLDPDLGIDQPEPTLPVLPQNLVDQTIQTMFNNAAAKVAAEEKNEKKRRKQQLKRKQLSKEPCWTRNQPSCSTPPSIVVSRRVWQHLPAALLPLTWAATAQARLQSLLSHLRLSTRRRWPLSTP